MGAEGCTLNTPRDSALHPMSVSQHTSSRLRSLSDWGAPRSRGLHLPGNWAGHLLEAFLLGGAAPIGMRTLACPWGLSVLATLTFPLPALSACFFPTRPHGNYKELGGGGRTVVHEA